MRTVPLSGGKAAGRVIEVDDGDDYELLMRYRWHVQEQRLPNGGTSGPYGATHLPVDNGRYRKLLAHQLLMPGVAQIDHADGNGLNCQRFNLRPASKPQNGINTGKYVARRRRPFTSQYKGVSLHRPGIWKARIAKRYLGLFADEVAAALAYDAAAAAEYGPFARLNFPA